MAITLWPKVSRALKGQEMLESLMWRSITTLTLERMCMCTAAKLRRMPPLSKSCSRPSNSSRWRIWSWRSSSTTCSRCSEWASSQSPSTTIRLWTTVPKWWRPTGSLSSSRTWPTRTWSHRRGSVRRVRSIIPATPLFQATRTPSSRR